MPHDIDFPFPVPSPRPDAVADAVNEHTLDWATAHDLVSSTAARTRYDSWDLGLLACWSFPDASMESRELYADELGFWFLFDDQFDGPLGLDVPRCRQVCEEMITIIHTTTAPPRSAAARALTDLWHRMSTGMSSSWRSRMVYHWEQYFAAYVHEAVFRVERTPPGATQFWDLRRCAGATKVIADSIDRLSGGELPPTVRCAPLIQRLVTLSSDLPVWTNDYYTLEREEARGDTVNLILVLEHEHRCDRATAVARSVDLIVAALDEFARLHAELPAVTRTMGLPDTIRAAAERYARDLRGVMDGYYQWERRTMRYRPEGQLAPDGPGYLEDLVSAPAAGTTAMSTC